MAEMSQPRQPDSFRAVLYPHRSLSKRGFLILMTAISLVSFVAGLVFYQMGAWPVPGFFGLDVLIIYIAFRRNYRDARLYELLEIDHQRLELTRVFPSGKREGFKLNPYWTRVSLTTRTEGRTDLALTLHGKAYPIGDFLSDEERGELAEAINEALAVARRPAAV